MCEFLFDVDLKKLLKQNVAFNKFNIILLIKNFYK